MGFEIEEVIISDLVYPSTHALSIYLLGIVGFLIFLKSISATRSAANTCATL